jgi:hypothetical protein
MAKGIKRRLGRVLIHVNREISAFAKRDHIAGALAGESYNGGYRDALYDVLCALNGVTPNRNYWWMEEDE